MSFTREMFLSTPHLVGPALEAAEASLTAARAEIDRLTAALADARLAGAEEMRTRAAAAVGHIDGWPIGDAQSAIDQACEAIRSLPLEADHG